MTIECKDLEWLWDGQVIASQSVKGVDGYYFVYYFDQRDAFEVHYQPYNGNYHHRVYIGTRDSFESAQAAANNHNKQQFQSIIDMWGKK